MAVKAAGVTFSQAAKKAGSRTKSFFTHLTLSRRFMLASLVILLAGMLGIGAWVARQVEIGVINRTGATTAIFVDSFVSPQLQVLDQSTELFPENAENLGNILQDTPLSEQIVAIKIWSLRGRLLYTTDPSEVGRLYPMGEGLLRARLGEVVSSISSLDDEADVNLAAQYDRLLETYSPVWLSGTDQIIAVAEFYQLTEGLDREIRRLQRNSWLVVGLSILVIYLLLSDFVRKASDMITRQQAELEERVGQLTGLLAQNQDLHQRVRRAAGSVALMNESNLRRIGSELHDGPAQELGLSLLKLDSILGQMEQDPEKLPNPQWVQQVSGIEASLQNALKEMRGIAAGLAVPQLAELDLNESVVRAVRSHERRTGTKVALEIGPVSDRASLPLRITVYRLIQEALTNSYRHAGGIGQQVRLACQNDHLVVEISDQGPGFSQEREAGWNGHLGIVGMRERVESLGGEFHIESSPGQGTRVVAVLPWLEQENEA